LHPLQHAGLSRRSLSSRPSGSKVTDARSRVTSKPRRNRNVDDESRRAGGRRVRKETGPYTTLDISRGRTESVFAVPFTWKPHGCGQVARGVRAVGRCQPR
jgi:hypothetical protein